MLQEGPVQSGGGQSHEQSVLDIAGRHAALLEPLLNSQAYANGDLAIFFLWDEDTPIPNVVLAPSILPGTKMTVQSGNPISHFSALRTWEGGA